MFIILLVVCAYVKMDQIVLSKCVCFATPQLPFSKIRGEKHLGKPNTLGHLDLGDFVALFQERKS